MGRRAEKKRRHIERELQELKAIETKERVTDSQLLTHINQVMCPHHAIRRAVLLQPGFFCVYLWSTLLNAANECAIEYEIKHFRPDAEVYCVFTDSGQSLDGLDEGV